MIQKHMYNKIVANIIKTRFLQLRTYCWKITSCQTLWRVITTLLVGDNQKRVRLNYATTYHHRPPPTTMHYQPKYPPPPTTTQSMDHHPVKANVYPYITSFWPRFSHFFSFENTIVVYLMEILCNKVLMSSFFKFKISTTFYDI